MATETITTETPADLARRNGPLRVAPVLMATAIYWIAFVAFGYLDNGLTRFMARMAAATALTLFFAVWWLFKRKFRLSERLLVLAWAAGFGAIAMLMRHPSFSLGFVPMLLLYTLPPLITGWTVWLWATRLSSTPLQRLGMLAIPLVVWAAATAVRLEGLSGDGNPDFHPRWVPSAEEQFLAERVRVDRKADAAADAAEPLVAAPHDWTEFRGPMRDGALHGVKIATNWNVAPPKLAWRRRVGPGWSSIIVVGNRLFTQEQRDKKEAVVCCDAKTGNEVWSHEDAARFSEELGGDGPRATPTFVDGKIYALGATGILNCLDAATGKLHWSQKIAKVRKAEPAGEADAAAKEDASAADKAHDAGLRPMHWGYSSSPLVIGDVVIVFAGGDREDSLLAYHAESGELAWKANSGTHSYSSPQLSTFDGKKQVLFLSDLELTALDPATGRTQWRFESGLKPGEAFPAIQPHLVSPTEVLISFSPDTGSMLLEVSPDGEGWKVEQKWKSKGDFKPYFNDFVQYEDALYGFEAPLFCCIDPHTGKRLWKKGRYGAGQVLLLADQGVLLVLSEQGEAVLVAADPKKHRELGRFQAINGKTWNHPAIVDGRLYVRNAEEMACYELKP